MSRITGSDARGLLEAYSSVYASQELTEEQIWEEVENWVNSLLEEGYDLSEYTWEEMYEEYLKEYGENAGIGYANRPGTAAQLQQRSRNIQARGGGFGQIGRAFTRAFGSGEQIAKLDAEDKADRRREQTALNRASNPNWKPTSKPEKPVQKPDQKPTRVIPPAATPASAKTAPTRPAAPAKPATGMLGKTSFERRTPTSAELKAAQAARAGGANPEQALRAAKAAGTAAKIQSAGQTAGAKAFSSPTAGASAFKPATSAPEVKQTATIAATPKPTPVAPRQTARERVLNQSYEYDAFDLVLEYLIDNGHVETIDEALYVMLEMEAEVIQDIVKEVLDEDAKYDRNRRRAAQRAAARNAARDAGKTGAVPGVGYVTPRRENETYRDSAGVERHTSGARMPQKDK